MTYTKEQVEAALAEADRLAAYQYRNDIGEGYVILAAALRDAWAERDRLRAAAEEAYGIFIENANWLLPQYGKTVRQLEDAIEGKGE